MLYMDSAGTTLAARYAEMALADELFAHYQYWLGSVIVSDEYETVISQFVEHASDEEDHATELAVWLSYIPREGKIPYSMAEIGSRGKQECGYIYPSGNIPSSLIADALKGEKCAIKFYTRFLDDISQVEYYGGGLARSLETILAKEKEHAKDLEKLSNEV